MAKVRDPLVLEVVAWLGGAGRVVEDWISGRPGETVQGLAQGSRICVNPVPETLDSCIHECLHVLRPQWTELGVRRKTKAIMRSLSEQEVVTLWQIYRDRVRRDRGRRRRGKVPDSGSETGDA